MRKHTILATVALAAAALIGGAATATADDGPGDVMDVPVFVCGSSGSVLSDCWNH